MKSIDLLRNFTTEYNKLLYSSYEIDGEKLYPVEINSIAAFGAEPSAGVAKLSRDFGVTKSAVSQKVNRLCKKGYLALESKIGRKKTFLLTAKGKVIFRLREKLASNYMRELTEIFSSIEESETLAFNKIMNQLIALHENKDFQQELEDASN